MGVEIQKNQQLEQVKDKIRKKLRLWASVKLSLAGRVVMVNHILLATMWHLAACWMLNKARIKNIKAMGRGFLWSGKDNKMTSAKVRLYLVSFWCKVYNPNQNCGWCSLGTELTFGALGMLVLGRQTRGGCAV